MYIEILELSGDRYWFHDKCIGRIFKVLWMQELPFSDFIILAGNLVGEPIFEGDDGFYLFSHAKVKEVSNPTLI